MLGYHHLSRPSPGISAAIALAVSTKSPAIASPERSKPGRGPACYSGSAQRCDRPADLDSGLDDHVELAVEGHHGGLAADPDLLLDRMAVERVDRQVPLPRRRSQRDALDGDRGLDDRLVAGPSAIRGVAELLQEHLADPAGHQVVDQACGQPDPRQDDLALGVAVQQVPGEVPDKLTGALERRSAGAGPLAPPGVDLEESVPPGALAAPEVAAEGFHPLVLADAVGRLEAAHRLRVAVGLAPAEVGHRVVDEYVRKGEPESLGDEDVSEVAPRHHRDPECGDDLAHVAPAIERRGHRGDVLEAPHLQQHPGAQRAVIDLGPGGTAQHAVDQSADPFRVPLEHVPAQPTPEREERPRRRCPAAVLHVGGKLGSPRRQPAGALAGHRSAHAGQRPRRLQAGDDGGLDATAIDTVLRPIPGQHQVVEARAVRSQPVADRACRGKDVAL